MNAEYWQNQALFWSKSLNFWRLVPSCDKAYHVAHADYWFQDAYRHLMAVL